MSERFLILGVGNPLMGDDGLGIEALTRLRDEWVFPPGVELVDGGTWGMQLLPAFEAADEVVILDAIEAERPPGTVLALSRDELPKHLRLRVSPHHVGLEDVLALLELRDTAPDRMAALGIQPELVEWGTGLTPAVEAALPTLLTAVVLRLEQSGVRAVRRVPAHA